MLLNVKILGGLECQVETGPDDTVDHLKAEVETKLRLAKSEQKLLFKGKALQDGIPLSEYQLTDGARINLVVKREASGVQPPETVNKQATKTDEDPEQDLSIDTELFQVLRKHFQSDADTKKVVDTFKKIYHQQLSHLSLNDWERIFDHYHKTNTIYF